MNNPQSIKKCKYCSWIGYMADTAQVIPADKPKGYREILCPKCRKTILIIDPSIKEK